MPGYEAIRAGDSNVGADFFRSAFENVMPLSRSAPERIEEVRQLRDRAIPASGAARTSSSPSVAGSRRVVLG